MSTAANNDMNTFSSEVAFVPVRVSQKATYNFKVLNNTFLEYINNASAKINALEEMSQDIVKSILLNSIKDTYFSKKGVAVAEEDNSAAKGKKRKESDKLQAPSSYLLFSNAKRDEIIKANPGIAFTDVGKKAGEMWKSLSDDQKKPYVDQSNAIKEQINAGTYVKPEKKAKTSTSAKPASSSTKTETPAPKAEPKKAEAAKPAASKPASAASKSKK